MKVRFGAALSAALVLAPVSAQTQGQPRPLIHAHAHNDYLHKRPLLDALDHGFCSVEADIYLVNGRLLVAHNWFQTRPERTLQALYLDPLRERVRKNDGHVYPGGPECTLLVEIKDDWKTTYPVLRACLEKYADILTTFSDGKKEPKAITVIITGHRAKDMFAGEAVRYAALDGGLTDLGSALPATLIPWISADWAQSFKWRGAGTIPDAERLKLKAIVAKAHQQGRRVRFWGAPDKPAFWGEMRAADVDLINTDDLDGLTAYLGQ